MRGRLRHQAFQGTRLVIFRLMKLRFLSYKEPVSNIAQGQPFDLTSITKHDAAFHKKVQRRTKM
jgi:hypothetical protein